MRENSPDWKIYTQNSNYQSCEEWELPSPPSWRPFGQEGKTQGSRQSQRADTFQPQEDAINMVNAALYLRRPLLLTGQPGTGKSSLPYAVAKSLGLGEVLYWPITTSTTLKNGLYSYDAIGRLQDTQQQEYQRRLNQAPVDPPSADLAQPALDVDFSAIGNYITLGPLGTALLPSSKPRVLLIDEIDKSDIDLPNNLLTILEEGQFLIEELERIKEKVPKVTVRTAYPDLPSSSDHDSSQEGRTALAWQPARYEVPNGLVTCTAFPLVFFTSNGERAFPPAFLRRCLRLRMQVPKGKYLASIVDAHLKQDWETCKAKITQEQGEAAAEAWYQQMQQDRQELVAAFENRCESGDLIATDQLLNALFMLTREHPLVGGDKEQLKAALMKQLISLEDG